MLRSLKASACPEALARILVFALTVAVTIGISATLASDSAGPCPGDKLPVDSLGGPETTMVLTNPTPGPSLFEIVSVVVRLFL